MGEYAMGAGGACRQDIPSIDPSEPSSWRQAVSLLRSCVESLYQELPAASHEVYSQAVERLFRERTGGLLTLAPADWDQIDRWWSAGVPLWIALDGLREAMRRTGSRGDARRMRSLRYCAPSIEERFAAWTRARAGASIDAETPLSDSQALVRQPPSGRPAALLLLREGEDRAARRGLSHVVALLEAIRLEVEAIRPEMDAPAERLWLDELDERLSLRLVEVVEADVILSLRLHAQEELEPHRARMTPDAFERTLERLVRRRLRDRLGVPLLSGVAG